MEKDTHYEVDLRKRTVGVHEKGVEFVEDQLGIDNLYEAANSPLVSYPNNALKARSCSTATRTTSSATARCSSSTSSPVGCSTGAATTRACTRPSRPRSTSRSRREPDAGHHHAAELLPALRQARRMTGTAQTEAAELHEIYKLGVVSIPTNKPMIRTDQSDLIYKTEEAKYVAVVDDVAERYEKGQPVLIGTTSVERSEYLSRQFTKRRLPHNVLNAKTTNRRRASSPSRAAGGITVATTWPAAAPTSCWRQRRLSHRPRLRERGLDPVETPDEYEAAWHQELPGSRRRPARRPPK
ncbi:secA precross-linking domain protein [Mycobacterium kansasii]|uniref:SecA precross-linking domain protein n=1 Tax=Mycobacterium kansasii TaxID=1768 RepID=A0A1V3W9E4_MYCKA|nr:secA precross-linking domain protein [Mycobacterium kansasii]